MVPGIHPGSRGWMVPPRRLGRLPAIRKKGGSEVSNGPRMKHRIDPTVDCVFKALLGSPRHSDLLLDFLNGVLRPTPPIAQVQILNPYNEREFEGDKLTIVDVKATDERGVVYQVEIQLERRPSLPARMLYNWSSLYHEQLVSGDDYDRLRPVVCIWVLRNNLLTQSPACHHQFLLHDPEHRVTLSEHIALHILELAKWHRGHGTLDGRDRWLYFFKEAREWNALPPEIETPEMRRAMAVLREFSEKQLNHMQYMSRLDALRLHRQRERELREVTARAEKEKARAEKEKARAEKEKARAEKETARAEKEKARALRAEEEEARLRALLMERGIDPGTRG